MFAVLWFLLIVFVITISLSWLLDHNGNVLVNWLGYEIQTDVLTAILLAAFCSLLIFAISYLVARILSIRFPSLLKLIFKRSYSKTLEKIIHRHHQAFETIVQLLIALEINDEKSIEKSHKSLNKLTKNNLIKNFFAGKILLCKKDFSGAAEFFTNLGDVKQARILVLKANFKLCLQNKSPAKAVAYGKQILELQKNDLETASDLLGIYRKQGMWQEVKDLISRYGIEKFKEEMRNHDLAVFNTSLAIQAYQKKKLLLAIRHCKIALKAESNFLPANEVMLKSLIKLGLYFRATWKIKALWRESPNLILTEIYDLIYRKHPLPKRLQALKKLVGQQSNNKITLWLSNISKPIFELIPKAKIFRSSETTKLAIANFALARVAFKGGDYKLAKEFLSVSLDNEKSNASYKLLAKVQKRLGNSEESKKSLIKAQMFSEENYYICNSCNHSYAKWSAICPSCNSYDSLDQNN